MKAKIYIFVLISVILISACKTISIDEQQPHMIPESIELVKIPAGNYTAGQENVGKYIGYDYYMMKYPVTNAQYIEYLKEASASGDVTITGSGVTGYFAGDKNWPAGIYEFTDFYDPDSRIGFNPPDEYVIKFHWVNSQKEYYDLHPVTEVTWFGANAFAEYYGMRLPTTEEWEKAARANTGYKYPWGNNFDSTKVNFFNSGDSYEHGTNPVGYFNGRDNKHSDSFSPYGIYDMCGNVWEWTESWKDHSAGRIIRGGSWRSIYSRFNTVSELFTWFEPTYGYSPHSSSSDIGFRCVKDAD